MEITVIIIVVLGVIITFMKKLKGLIYYIPIVDIVLRMINFLGENIKIDVFQVFVEWHIPNGWNTVIYMYTTGIIAIVLTWLIFIAYGYFIGDTIRLFFNRK